MNENSDNSRHTLARLKHEAFEGSDDALAVALGKPLDEIQLWFEGGEIDEDSREKINGLAQQRLKD